MVIDCIIPAAGASSRMGAWKAVLPFGGATMVETVVRAALDAGTRVILVAGFRADDLAALFTEEPRVEVVRNPGWQSGMLGSIQRGLSALESDRFFVTPADMPLIIPSFYTALEAAWSSWAAPGPRPLFAAHLGEPGHPVLIPSALVPEILRLAPDARLRPFLLERGGRLVECGSGAVLADIDAPADYEAARTGRE